MGCLVVTIGRWGWQGRYFTGVLASSSSFRSFVPSFPLFLMRGFLIFVLYMVQCFFSCSCGGGAFLFVSCVAAFLSIPCHTYPSWFFVFRYTPAASRTRRRERASEGNLRQHPSSHILLLVGSVSCTVLDLGPHGAAELTIVTVGCNGFLEASSHALPTEVWIFHLGQCLSQS